jgi:Uma2 family endonuclease
LYLIFFNWSLGRGRIAIEWAVILTRDQVDWVPIPDLLFVSNERLAMDWQEDAPCPVPPELAIEIISPDQTFGSMVEKATDYLTAGVSRVWVVDPRARSITVFYPDRSPHTFSGTAVLTDPLLTGLQITAQEIFQQPG